jgi:hypothetical protein
VQEAEKEWNDAVKEANDRIAEVDEAAAELEDAQKALSDADKNLEAARARCQELLAFLYGENETVTKKSGSGLDFGVNGDLPFFTDLIIDGQSVDLADYDAEQGSSLFSLDASYLDGLKIGSHDLTVVYEYGQVSTNFTVKEAEKKPAASGGTSVSKTKKTGAGKGSTKGAKTGDASSPAAWLGLFAASLAALAGFRRKDRSEA